ncbi:MAG: response regulator transcription factor [Bacteroidia bacterium]|nr:response regulator transcription factor [Bacteroidia bacterium]
METITAIIVDDEQGARDILENVLTTYIEGVEILAKCSNFISAVDSIKELKPDLVFLDIEMPQYNGFELLKFFNKINFEIVFVTAYNQYALKAFEVSAVDYILKPIQIEKIEAAVKKVRNKKELSTMQNRLEMLEVNMTNDEFKKLALPMAEGLKFVDISDIACMEADGSYTKVCFINKQVYLVSKKIKFFEEALAGHPNFIRVHRSSIVNINHINNYIRQKGIITLSNSKEVKVARERKADFEKALKEIKV